jgi:hypothetical protein
MRSMLTTIALVGLTGFAQPQTINIQTTSGFGNLHQYHDAVTDVSGVTVTMYLPQSAATGGMTLWFPDQVNPANNSFTSYYVGNYNGNGAVSVLEKCVFVDMYTCVRNGEMLAVTLHETSVRKQINSGRAHYWVTKWTLLDGVIDR